MKSAAMMAPNATLRPAPPTSAKYITSGVSHYVGVYNAVEVSIDKKGNWQVNIYVDVYFTKGLRSLQRAIINLPYLTNVNHFSFRYQLTKITQMLERDVQN